MSRREEGRDSDSRRHRSRFDREPSPKRPRRDGKLVTERERPSGKLDGPSGKLDGPSGKHDGPSGKLDGPSGKLDVDTEDHDQKHRRRLQDVVPLDAPLAPDQKVEVGVVGKDTDKKSNGHRDGTKHSSNPNEAHPSKSYFQHDERGNARQVDRSHSRREAGERGRFRDSKDQPSERTANRTTVNDTLQKGEKPHARRDDNRAWRHDRFHERESEPKPSSRKRPAFREQKVPAESESVEKTVYDPLKPSENDRPYLGSERREDRVHDSRHLKRPDQPFARDGNSNRSNGDSNRSNNPQRGYFSPRERYASGGMYRGRENFTLSQGYRPSGARVEKWKHDLYDEANKSPTIKNEDDQIAKVEALLSL